MHHIKYRHYMKYGILGAILLLFLINGAGLSIYISENKNSLILNPYVRKLLPIYRSIREVKKITSNILYVPWMLGHVEMPEYELIIDSADLQKLNKSLPDSTSLEVLTGQVWFGEENKKTVPAMFIYEDQEYDVNVRYRGDNPNHWTREKRSWQVKFDKDNLFEGLRTLKFILPSDRQYLAPYLNNYRAQKFGLAVPDAKLIKLEINGRDFGVYHQVEDWSKEFLEKNKLPADANLYITNDEILVTSGALAFDNSRFWTKQTEDRIFDFDNFGEMDTLINILNNEKISDISRLLSEIVDLENFYNWNAVAMLAGSTHQCDKGNLRLYFNTSKGKFQFIPWDVGVGNAIQPVTHRLAEAILQNSEYMQEQKKVLWDYVKNENNLIDDLQFYDEMYKKFKPAFYADWVKYDSNGTFDKKIREDRDLFESNFQKIKEMFQADDSRMVITYDNVQKIVALSFEVDNFGGLLLSSIQIPTNVYAAGALYYDSNNDGQLGKDDRLLTRGDWNKDKNSISFQDIQQPLFGNVENESSTYTFFARLNTFNDLKANVLLRDISIATSNLITGEEVAVKDVRLADVTTFSFLSQINKSPEQFVRENSIFYLANNQIILPSGYYGIKNDLIIPKNTMLVIKPGVILSFAPGISLISYSPINAQGVEYSPIIFQAENSSLPWGVVGVVNAGEDTSRFSFVQFRNGNSAYINGLFFSGMLSVFHSDVILESSKIENAQNDDGVNVKYGNAVIRYNNFKNNSADALDLDFVTGTVDNNDFFNNGNDAIDVSGAEILIKNNFIKGSGDKGISVGEKSDIDILNNVIVNSNNGIAIKDSSFVDVINSVVVGNAVGIDAFVKKPIFGGGTVNIVNSIIWGNQEQIRHDVFSTIKTSFSDIEGGYAGEGVVTFQPIFNDVSRNDYGLSTNNANELLKGADTGSSIGIINEL